MDKRFGAGAVVALGNFDGVHIGHRKLIETLVSKAAQYSLPSAVWTFLGDPADCLSGSITPQLTSADVKKEILTSLGVDYVDFEDFKKFSNLSGEEFCRSVLIGKYAARAVVCGFNYKFGKGALCDSGDLVRILSPHQTEVQVIPPVFSDDRLVSSGLIRSLLAEGKTESANKYLGYPYFINSTVSHGKKIGRTLDAPTVNHVFSAPPPLRYGVYLTKCRIGEREYYSLSNVGTSPTVPQKPLSCETHILDFSGDLYGRDIKISFISFLRDEQKFSDISQLQQAISHDIQKARYIISKMKEGEEV